MASGRSEAGLMAYKPRPLKQNYLKEKGYPGEVPGPESRTGECPGEGWCGQTCVGTQVLRAREPCTAGTLVAMAEV